MARLTPSTRASALTTTAGAQTTTVNIPGGNWAVIAFSFTNVNGAPSAVALDGQPAPKLVSNEVGGTDEIALYKVAGFSAGSGKILAWTNPSGIATLNAAIEYREGTPTYGATDTDSNASGDLSSLPLANSSGDEILAGYIATAALSGIGSGQTQLDDTNSGSVFYGFTTETGTGVTDTQLFQSTGAKGYAVVVITVAVTRELALLGVGV